MRDLLNTIIAFINKLSFVDLLILVILVILIVLIIVLICALRSYSKIKSDVKQLEDAQNNVNNVNVVESIIQENDKKETIDLSSITKELESAEKKNISLTPYEEEQEERAIISYEELIKAKNDLILNYEDEEDNDGVVVKKVNMENMTTVVESTDENSISDSSVSVISYEREEAFLQTLKQLQQLLNN